MRKFYAPGGFLTLIALLVEKDPNPVVIVYSDGAMGHSFVLVNKRD